LHQKKRHVPESWTPLRNKWEKVSCVEHVSERRVEHELELQSSAEESSVAEREDDPYTYIHTYIHTYVCMGLSY
jgi:hypothetical protein